MDGSRYYSPTCIYLYHVHSTDWRTERASEWVSEQTKIEQKRNVQKIYAFPLPEWTSFFHLQIILPFREERNNFRNNKTNYGMNGKDFCSRGKNTFVPASLTHFSTHLFPLVYLDINCVKFHSGSQPSPTGMGMRPQDVISNYYYYYIIIHFGSY